MQIQTKKKLNYLDETKGLIREAIEAKGQSVADSDTFRSYADKIRAIETASDPVLENLNVTENGNYTPPDGVDGFGSVSVNVDPTKITLLKETEISGFEVDDELGYSMFDGNPSFAIEIGEKYFVTWDGVTYETTAMDASAVIPGALFMGNGTMLGLPGNDEPFAIGFISGQVVYVAFADPAESHTVGIYESAIKEIKLQDKTITENGEYTADAGFDGLGKVLVEIASGGGSYKAKYANFTASGTSATVSHYLGVIPDILFLVPSAPSSGKLLIAVGVSSSLIAENSGLKGQAGYYNSNGVVGTIYDTVGMDVTTSENYAKYGGFRNVTASTFTVGGTTGQLKSGDRYYYYALYKVTE